MSDTPNAGIETFVLDDDLVLFDARGKRLFSLNPTASFIWTSLVANAGVDEIVADLVAAVGAPAADARRDVLALLEQWRGERLLGANGAATPPAQPAGGGQVAPAIEPPRGVARTTRAVPLMDRGVRITYDDDLAGAVDSVLGPTTAGAEAAAGWPTLTFFRAGQRCVLLLDGLWLDECRDSGGVVPLLYGNLARLIYDAADCFAAIHAAAVASGSSCVLLPAESTSGKSTLTAALLAAGYDYCTDDLALLTRPPLRLRPVPMRVGLKTGSWDVIAKRGVDLAALPAYRRVDGQVVKYLDPATLGTVRSPRERLRVTAAVFPRFVPGAAVRLEPLSRGTALARIAGAGYDLAERLNTATVEAIIDWLGTIDCYELEYGDLDAALAEFRKVLP